MTKGVTVNLNNTSKSAPYLVQSYISDKNINSSNAPDNSAPFQIIPPLTRVNASSTSAVKVVLLPGIAHLPQDRESLFYFTARALPSISPLARDANERDTGGSVTSLIAIQIKLFYRPEQLPVSQYSAFKGLQLIRQPGVIVAKNASPYYLVLTKLSFGGKPVALRRNQDDVIAPFSQQVYGSTDTTATSGSWTLLDDKGAPQTFSTLIQ